MKNGTCVKCKSSNVAYNISDQLYSGIGGAKNAIQTTAWGYKGVVPITRYACIDCGYSEEWIDKEEHRKLLIEKGPYVSTK